MADDLDDFFNEIEEVEQEVDKEEETEEVGTSNETKALTSVEQETSQPPPAKRAKSESAPIRPRGLVVAAASSAVIRKPVVDGTQQSTTIHDGTTGGGFVTVHPVSSSLPMSISSSHPHAPQHHHQHQQQSQAQISQFPPPPPPPPPPSTNANTTTTTTSTTQQSQSQKKPIKRIAAGKVWVDPTLDEWPENDFRIFCGNLDKTVTDQQLYDHYKKYASLAKAKVVQDTKGSSKGYGFVSFLQPLDCAKAIRETDQTWLGARPIRVKRSDWKERNLTQVMKNSKKQEKQRKRMGLS